MFILLGACLTYLIGWCKVTQLQGGGCFGAKLVGEKVEGIAIVTQELIYNPKVAFPS
jgi:hypothetical protein